MPKLTAWLMLAAGDSRQHGGNEGYDDDPARHYSWDSTVANHAAPRTGDIIVLWDKETLLGASVIERIEVASDVAKVRLRCPNCERTTIKERKSGPRFRCYTCKHEFDEARSETLVVDTYRSLHPSAWVDLAGRLKASEIRALCEEPKSIQSLRRLDWPRFEARLDATGLPETRLVSRMAGPLPGGHGQRTVRVRLGQAAFRRRLEERFGGTCAFTGPTPAPALEAAHLYAYAEVGRHEEHGGLLLRRDIHRLFDLGFLAIHPDTMTVDVADELKGFDYGLLHGKPLRVEVPEQGRRWLAEHWAQHRGGAG